MPSNTIVLIDEALKKLATEKSIEAGLIVASHVLTLAGVGGLRSNDPASADYALLTALKLPNAERYDHWFQAHPKFKSNRACFTLNDIKQSNIEAKFYALKTKKKMYISGAVHFTSNFEDAQFTRQDPNAKVGIDFFLPPSNDSLLVVISSSKSLRVVELKDRLTNTQRDIFSKWLNVASLEREQLHLTIWESFKLKSINEAFYKGIANSFKELVSHLESAGKSSNEARHFANRLHGRLLFCWFLEKKGFINREVDYFNTTHTDASQYYKDKLELLFFDTLNTPQSERERSHPDLKTPYLNGGLFEARSDDWQGTNVPFPQGFFIRLYEHFGEFNFTTDESTPDYEQIAIDPEMLGKIFENLLAEINEDTGEQARRARGAFYTPREIVAYMCRESVREYLYNANKGGEKAKISIDKLLDTSDSDWAKSGTNSKRDAVDPVLREKIIKALDEMKVLDPACGSGAFPIGMLHLLVQIYERLDARFDPYRTKLSIMEHNIYGVDIESLAIEIARLRSFLALVVDQEYAEKKTNGGIDTLPNLEFKFVCANTLIPLAKQGTLETISKYNALLEIKREYFKATPKQREKLEMKYNTLRKQGSIFDSRLSEQLQTYDPFNNDHPASFYDQHLMHDITDAFSIVIGNPPYIKNTRIKSPFKSNLKEIYTTLFDQWDLYVAFFEISIRLLNETGIAALITPNQWLSAKYGGPLRSLLVDKVRKLVDYRSYSNFTNASVNTFITFYKSVAIYDDVSIVTFDSKGGSNTASVKRSDFINASANLGALLSNDITVINRLYFTFPQRFSDHYKIGHSFSIPDFYKLSEYVREAQSISDSDLKLVSTGTLSATGKDYGIKKFKYAGKLYTNPVVDREVFMRIFPLRSIQAGPKLIISSMGGLKIAIDSKGEFLGTRPTMWLSAKSDIDLKVAFAILSSTLINWFYSQQYSVAGMTGFSVRYSHIKTTPHPDISNEDKTSLVELVDKYLLLVNNSSRETGQAKLEIDEFVYKLYQLHEDEISLIKSKLK